MDVFNNFLQELTDAINVRTNSPLHSVKLKKGQRLRIKLNNGQEITLKNLPAFNEPTLYALAKILPTKLLARAAGDGTQPDFTPEPVITPAQPAGPGAPAVPTNSLIPGVPAAFNDDILKTAKYLIPILLVFLAGAFIYFFITVPATPDTGDDTGDGTTSSKLKSLVADKLRAFAQARV